MSIDDISEKFAEKLLTFIFQRCGLKISFNDGFLMCHGLHQDERYFKCYPGIFDKFDTTRWIEIQANTSTPYKDCLKQIFKYINYAPLNIPFVSRYGDIMPKGMTFEQLLIDFDFCNT